MSLLTIGVFGTSRKKYEKRVPIHPDHLNLIDKRFRDNMFFEKNYGLNFGKTDDQLASLCGGVLSRNELLNRCDIALMAKPILEDFKEMTAETIHWGWPHCVQSREITQTAIDNKLTLIAWEAMHSWSEKGAWQGHTFHSNNEIAGYAGVHHAMSLIGVDGHFGPKRKAMITSYGSVSRGAILALKSRGVEDITVYTHRNYQITANKIEGVQYGQFEEDENGHMYSIQSNKTKKSFIEALKEADIIINGILQDTDHPIMLVPEHQNHLLKKACLIIDISCDEGMAFSFAKPTNFETPIIQVGELYYYAVDHTPSYLWRAASWEISKSLIPYLSVVMGGEKKWEQNETIRRAIEIKKGVIINQKINSFQNRSSTYPPTELTTLT